MNSKIKYYLFSIRNMAMRMSQLNSKTVKYCGSSVDFFANKFDLYTVQGLLQDALR